MLLLLPTEKNKLTLAWRGPYKVVGVVGEVDYKIQIVPDKVKTYHINMLKRYFYCEGVAPPQDNRSQPTQVGEVVNETTVDSDRMSIDQAVE